MSVLQVNTINEVTSANGVTVDGLSLKDGNVVPAAGKGITFSTTNTPAQSDGTGSHNTLDDYEEGTWTPRWTSSGGNLSYNTGARGKYTKIGNLVYVKGLLPASWSGASGELYIHDFPFTAQADNAYASMTAYNFNFNGTFDSWQWGIRLNGGTVYANVLAFRNDGTYLFMTANDNQDGSSAFIEFSMTYTSA